MVWGEDFMWKINALFCNLKLLKSNIDLRTSNVFQDPQKCPYNWLFQEHRKLNYFSTLYENLCKSSSNFPFWMDSPCLISFTIEIVRQLLNYLCISITYPFSPNLKVFCKSALCFSQCYNYSSFRAHRFFLFLFALMCLNEKLLGYLLLFS